MSYDLNRFRDLFFEEAAEHLTAMESGLLALEAGNHDLEIVHAVFRAAHSVKGVAGSLGFTAIAEFTHLVESVLGRFRDGTMAVEPPLVALIVRATDAMRVLVAAAATGESTDVSAVAAELTRVLDGQISTVAAPVAIVAGTPETQRYSVRFTPKPNFFTTGQDVFLVLRELTELGTDVGVSIDTSRLPDFDALEPQTCYLSWTVLVTTAAARSDIDDVFLFVGDDSDVTIEVLAPVVEAPVLVASLAAPASASAASTTTAVPAPASIRVAAEKVDALVDLVGELIIAQAMVTQIAERPEGVDVAALRDALSGLHRQTRELQESVMAIRMLPVETIFSRFVRLSRDLSAQLGKRVKLEMSGADTELDKGMLERLGDPLTHLVRNSIDHGLESTEDRRAAGKPDEGTISLQAYHESGGVVIEVADDGKGLDTARIRAKAIERGLITGTEALSDEEINALIFAPGFSTAAQITDVSGRGVGMDVVKRNVEALKGSISVTSTIGKGTRVRIKLPLTLAVLDGLVLRVAGESFVLPITAIAESLRPSPRDVRDLLGRGECITLRGESLPFVRLGDALGMADALEDPCQGIVVVVELDGMRFGLLVDEVIGEQQVVIKSLEANYRKVDGTMAATILGDGRVAFILAVSELPALAARARHAQVAA
ncbi:MAG TPA: chemotaxis protein CheA [Gemmatimonadaceae bacterium]|jgi:two-component system chemotaxis sensor kinase CheA